MHSHSFLSQILRIEKFSQGDKNKTLAFSRRGGTDRVTLIRRWGGRSGVTSIPILSYLSRLPLISTSTESISLGSSNMFAWSSSRAFIFLSNLPKGLERARKSSLQLSILRRKIGLHPNLGIVWKYLALRIQRLSDAKLCFLAMWIVDRWFCQMRIRCCSCRLISLVQGANFEVIVANQYPCSGVYS